MITLLFGCGSAHIITDPAELGTVAAWFTAYDNTYMTVNADGTGGAPADGGTIGRLLDRSGNNNHVSQSTAANQPLWRVGDGVNFRWDSSNNHSDLRNASTTTMPRQNSSGAMLVSLSGVGNVPLVDFGTTGNGYAVMTKNDPANDSRPTIHTGLAHESPAVASYITGRKCVLGWRSNASEFMFYVNNGTSTSMSPLSSLNMSAIYLGTFAGGAPKPCRLYEAVFYSEDIGDGNMRLLGNYLRQNADASAGDSTRTVIIVGDSLTVGVGSDINKPWHNYVTNRSSSVWYPWGRDGSVIQADDGPSGSWNHVNAVAGATENVVVFWKGANDILINSRTGAQVEADLVSYIGLLTGTPKIIVCTLPGNFTVGSGNTARTAFNVLLKANYASYADAIVKLDEAPELDDGTDTTYFMTDGVHMKDAGYAAAGALIQTAMASV